MERLDNFGRYDFSEGTIQKLLELKRNLNKRIPPPISPVLQLFLEDRPEGDEGEEGSEGIEEDQEFPETQLPATQFAIEEKTPKNVNRNSNSTPKNLHSVSNISSDLTRSLEKQNGEFEFDLIQSLSEEETIEVLGDVRETVTSVGLFNLCSSMIAMTSDLRIKYMTLLCEEILLPKLRELEGASKKMLMVLATCVETYPEDMQKLIFLKLLSGELRDEKIALSIFNAFDFERKCSLLPDFVENVKDLKPWHLLILQKVLVPGVENENVKNAIAKLLFDNASNFTRDNEFGKLVFLFLTESAPFTDTQMDLFRWISDTHESRSKKLIANALRGFRR